MKKKITAILTDCGNLKNIMMKVTVFPPRIELGAYSLEGCCSILLSYGNRLYTQNPHR